MPKLYSSSYIIRILESYGFKYISCKGSHKKYRKDSKVVIIPDPKKEIPVGTFRSIVRQSGLQIENFE